MAVAIAIASAVIAAVSAAAAVGMWVISRKMATAAKDSAAAALTSAGAAQRSATAAEESVQIQRRESEAREEARKRAQQADVVPLYWESRGGQTYGGLVVTNNGPAVAKDVVAFEMPLGGQMRKWLWPSLDAGETRGFREGELPVSSEEIARVGTPSDEDAYAFARVQWTNADGSSGLADWRGLQRR